MNLPAPRFSTIILFSFARMILPEKASLAWNDFGKRLSCSAQAPRRAVAPTWSDRLPIYLSSLQPRSGLHRTTKCAGADLARVGAWPYDQRRRAAMVEREPK